MGTKELRNRYGNKKCRQLINQAIRNEIPGGGLCIELLHELRTMRKNAVEKDQAMFDIIIQKVSAMNSEMAVAVMKRKQNDESVKNT